MTITRSIYDSNDKPKQLEEITWQTSYNFDSFEPGLVLYRSHRGITVEDKLHDEARKAEEAPYTFIPVCSGVTYFKIEIPKDKVQITRNEQQVPEDEMGIEDEWVEQEEEFLEAWDGPPPKGLVITISFGEPYKSVLGNMEVLEEDKYSRRIAVDRTRKIDFVIETLNFGDVNDIGDANERNAEAATNSERQSENDNADIPEQEVRPGRRR